MAPAIPQLHLRFSSHGSRRGVAQSRGNILWKGEVSCSRQEFFWRKCNLSVTNSRSLSEENLVSIRCSFDESASSSDGFEERYGGGSSFDTPCALSCPVSRDTYVQSWLEESVNEIARNIQEAPFLQYVLDAKRRSRRQKLPQDLLRNPHRWSQSPLRHALSQADPDGIILVQKLDPSCTSTACPAETVRSGDDDARSSGRETNVWGVLVQARGANGDACYLLETTRVLSPGGVCTRYCLTRAKCFGPSYGHQLQDSWLL